MKKKADHSPISTKEMAEMVKKGYPAKYIAQTCGVSVGTLFNRMKRDGYDKFGNKIE